MITPVNTVGCGDSMVAGFSIALEGGYEIEELIKFSTAIATANALTSYTGYFEKNDLDNILPQVKVTKIK